MTKLQAVCIDIRTTVVTTNLAECYLPTQVHDNILNEPSSHSIKNIL
jgi:hypothetical protein